MIPELCEPPMTLRNVRDQEMASRPNFDGMIRSDLLTQEPASFALSLADSLDSNWLQMVKPKCIAFFPVILYNYNTVTL